MTSVQYIPGEGGVFANGEVSNRRELSASSSPSSVHFALPRTTSPTEGRPASSRLTTNGKLPSVSPSSSLNSLAGPSRAHHSYTPSHLKQSTLPAKGKMRRARSESTAATLGGYVTTTDESAGERAAIVDVVPDRHSNLPSRQSSSSSSSGARKMRPQPQHPFRIPSSSSYHFPQVPASSSNRRRAHSTAAMSTWAMNGQSADHAHEFVSRDTPLSSTREHTRHPRHASSSNSRPAGRLSAQTSQDRLSNSGSILHPRRTREPSSEGMKRSESGLKPHHHGRSHRHRDESENESRASRDAKGKGRARDVASRSNFEAGLTSGSQQQQMDSERLAALVSSIDINGALRIISDQKLTLPRSASTNQRASLQAVKISHQEPFLIRAPPALTPRDPTSRERANSTATQSTVQSPVVNRQRQVSLSQSSRFRRDSSSAPLGRARAGSQVVQEDGGHVPFTHHARQASLSTDEAPEDFGARAPVPPDPPLKEMLVDGLQSTARKKGLGLLFSRNKRKNKEKSKTQSHILPAREQVVSLSPESAEDHQQEMRRRQEIEQERMELEAAQERTQATLAVLHQHPQAERAAYEARAHFQAYYNLIYDGVQTHNYVNPLLIIRWARRRDQQAEARARWESEGNTRHRSRQDGMFGDVVHSSPVSIPAHNRRSGDGGRPSSEYSSRRRNTFGTSHGTSASLASSAKHTERNRWKWTLEDARAFIDCKGEVDFFIPPHRDFTSSSQPSHRTPSSLMAPGFSRTNGSREEHGGNGSSTRSMRSTSTGPDMSSLGDAAEARRMSLAFGGSDLSRPVSHEMQSKQAAKLTKSPPVRAESADEATDREQVTSQRARHGHHARALVEHIRNAIPGRHDNDRGDGSASDTDRGDRSSFSPRAFAHGLRPFRTTTDNVTNGSPAQPRAHPGHSPHPSDDDTDLQINGTRSASKNPSTRAKVANAIRNRAHPKPSQEKVGKPKIEHVDDVGSLKTADALVESREEEVETERKPAETDATLMPVPRVRIEDDQLSEIYKLRKEQLSRVRRQLAALDDISAVLETSAKQMSGQISHIQKVVEVSAGYSPRWPDFNVVNLLSRSTVPLFDDHPEASDTLAPLQRRPSAVSGTDSDRTRRGSVSRRRSSTLKMAVPPVASARAASRRISLAPAEPIMLDPISRLAAVVDYAKQQVRDFAKSTAETHAYQVSTRTKMKAVEAKSAEKEVAARLASQEIKELDRERAKAAREAAGRFREKYHRIYDVTANVLIRALAARVFKIVRFFMIFPCFFGFQRSDSTGRWHWAPGWELLRTACFVPVLAVAVASALYYYGED